MMNRIQKTLLAVLAAGLCLCSNLAWAAGLDVRAAEHENYSRIVFDWEQTASYQKNDISNTEFELRFTLPGETHQGAVSAQNVQGFDVLSTKPLTVRITKPATSQVRAFNIGSRVIIDIYDAPGTKRQPPKQAEPKQAQKAPEPPPKKEKKPASDHKQDPVKQPPKAEEKKEEPRKDKQPAPKQEAKESKEPSDKDLHAVTEEEDSVEKQKTEEKQSTAQTPAEGQNEPEESAASPLASQAKPHLVSMTAASPFAMTVFEYHDKLYMIVGDQVLDVRPTINGPNADDFKPIQNLEIEGAQGYAIPTLPGAIPRVEGDDMIWKVIISPEEKQQGAIMPEYVNVRKDSVRGGSIFWKLDNAQDILEFEIPETGEKATLITVKDADNTYSRYRSMVDFDILTSYAGLAIIPKMDGLEVKNTGDGIEISRPGGLALTMPDILREAEKKSGVKSLTRETLENREALFDFKRWRMGGLASLNQNRNIILSHLKDQTLDDQIANLLLLGRMHLASGRGPEALGYLEFALREQPDLIEDPNFIALRGVAKAFSWKTKEAYKDLSSPLLKDYEETDVWKAFVLADIGDWAQAAEILPRDLSSIDNYTIEVHHRLALVLAEIHLRAGELEKAEALFGQMEQGEDKLNMALDAQLQYLKGEAARQRGNINETIKFWEPLTKGDDDLYRAKAGLALARLLMEEKNLPPKDVIDRLERLRYAWRGDQLEAQINYWLGRAYFENGQRIKGLKILRASIPMAKGTYLAQQVAHDMTDLFTGFFVGPALDKATPLDAVALYEEFTELVPSGDQGNQVIKRLAEHLVKADLLDRASALLQYQIDHRLKGDEAARTSVRLAAIRLLAKDPKGALESLAKAERFMTGMPPEIITEGRKQELALLRARALSQAKQPDQALALLEELPRSYDVSRLRADIAWQAGYWDDAALALEDVIADENISLTRPLTDIQSKLVLQRAIALNLSSDRIGLANMREKYSEAMVQTTDANNFEVVTRPRQNIGLADRNTMMSAVSEVDLFKDFLDSYKTSVPQEPVN